MLAAVSPQLATLVSPVDRWLRFVIYNFIQFQKQFADKHTYVELPKTLMCTYSTDLMRFS